MNSLSIILNNYLLPLYGKYSKGKLKTALVRFLAAISVPVWVGCLVTGRLAFLVFGKSFCFAWGELAWAATFTLVNFWLQVLVFFSMTLGGRALVCNGAAYVAFMAVQVLAMPLLIPRFGVAGAFQGMTAASAAGFAVVLATVLVLLRSRSEGADET